MDNIRYTNKQPSIGQMPPQGQIIPPQPPFQGVQLRQPLRNQPTGWRGRWMRRFGMDKAIAPLTKDALSVPNWLTGKSIVYFYISMLVCWGAFGFVPEFTLWVVSCISVVLFFYGSISMSKSWSRAKEKAFIRNVFIVGLVVRILWVLYCYFVFNPEYYGDAIGDKADVEWYMPFGKELAKWLVGDSSYSFSEITTMFLSSFDDTGYPMWLAIGYVIWGEWGDVLMPMLLKCLLGAYCAVNIYNITQRHYGEGAARTAAIFVALNPNIIYWCASMMKEAEMVFLVCLSVDNFDRVLTSRRRFTFKNLLPGILAATALMLFRSALGIVVFLAVFAHILMASNRVMSMGKKVLAGVLVGAVLLLAMGDRIRTQSQELLHTARSDSQQRNMEWRAQRVDDGGRTQSFAKYASAAVFAPLIFSIPFPTFNAANEGQLRQIMLSGGSYIKNILSFFVIIVMFMMLISGEWRRHVFIIAYTVGYLIVLIMSPFAQSGRFHMPIWPMLMLFAAYGVQIAKTNARLRKWFSIVLVVEVAICLFWNWFKLKGRGMI